MAGHDGAHALPWSVLPSKLQSFGIHAVDGAGGGHELPGQSLERRHVDLRRMEESDCAGAVRAEFHHGA
ncbi:MAG: hypothetical protein NVS3B6_15940 [Pseudarthrobacter sp.]